MACSCCSGIINVTLGTAARFGHLLLFVGLFILAVVMGTQYQDSIVGTSTFTYYYVDVPDSLNIEGLVEGCNSEFIEECVYRQLVYRASCILTVFFMGMALLGGMSDYINRSLWLLKIMMVFGLFVAFWYGTNNFFSGFAELARVVSFFWLLVQGLLVLDIAHDLHDIIMHKASEEDSASGGSSNTYKGLYLLVAISFLVMASVGLHYLFAEYAGCGTGMFFIVLTIIMGVLQTCTSALNSVNRGILTPLMMFAHATFMCWYALLSNPEATCNPSASINTSEAKSASIWIVTFISLVALLFCVGSGSRIQQIFLVSGEGVLESSYGGYGSRLGADSDEDSSALSGVLTGEKTTVTDKQPTASKATSEQAAGGGGSSDVSSGSYAERVFFHVLMALASCYGGMILTSWGKPDGSPESVGDYSYAGSESMWLKIISQWVFFIMYWKALHVAYSTQTDSSS